MDIPSSSLPQDGLFDAGLIERVEALDDGRVDANGGVRKRFKDFEPDAVMLVPPWSTNPTSIRRYCRT